MAEKQSSSGDPSERLPGSVLRLLAPERRRAVMRALMEEPNATHRVDDLVDAIQEVYDAPDVGGNQTYLRSSLHHTHLPKLDEADVVDYDAESGTIHYRGDPVVEQWVEQIDRIDEG